MKIKLIVPMLICFALFSNAQNDYESQWKTVVKHENEGLTKSALEDVEKIYLQAKSEKNQQQAIKAMLYKSKYILTLEEDAQLKIVDLFKTEIEKSDTVTKHLLENILANMYWQYYQQNRYKFYNRTKTEEKVSDDFRTWDLETLFTEIHTYFQKSIQNSLLLQQERLEDYETLLITAKNSKIFRPTLFDLLSHNALEFYKTSENSITQPSYKFKIDDEHYLADSETFINQSITPKDSASLQLNALKIYQNLLRFHRGNAMTEAFVANDIDRLKFAKQHSVLDHSDSLYLVSLNAKVARLKNNALSGLYQFEIAKLLSEQGQKYNSNLSTNENEALRWKIKEAITLCDEVVTKFPESDGAKKCHVLKQNLLLPNLSLKAENFIPTDKPSLILINYANLETLDFKIYKVSTKQLEKYNRIYREDEKANFLNKLKTDKTWTAKLKNENDYRRHTIEVLVPELQNGLYIIKAETKKDNVFATSILQVTNFALLESNESTKVTYQIIDRTNGAPIKNASVKMSYKTNRNNNRLSKTFTTDNLGKFVFHKEDSYLNSVEITVNHDNQEAHFGNSYINRKYTEKPDNTERYNGFLFTDRSIYRPGQTVYFKGIVTKTFQKKTEIATNESVFATLHNVNGEKLSELNFETNEFGSFHGEFILPNNGLTGQYYIKTSIVGLLDHHTYFSVEEYKRPKFETNFNPITESYKVNDSIVVKGNAIAFSGSTITDAKVNYRVKRNVQLPRWYYWYRPAYNSSVQEITFGETKTNNNGEFDIEFKTLPDESVSKENLPVFTYEITADVTDINGETRSATTYVRVGYHSLLATVEAPSRIDKTEKTAELKINTTNLNGEFIPAKGQLKIYKLVAPKAVLRPRPWSAPDYKSMTEEEFKNYFPHEAYDNENQFQNWKKGELVFEDDFDTEKSTTTDLKTNKKWASGKYIILLESKDNFGQVVKDQTYTTLFSPKDDTVLDNALFTWDLNKETYNIGDTAVLTFGSASSNLNVTVSIEKNGRITDTKIYKLNNNQQTIKLPITEQDLGGFVVHCSTSAFNSFISKSTKISVPYPTNDLQIETSTFRDKLQPGTEETWRFKIKGPKGDKVTAEILASMYDASLDEFRAHNWQFNPINQPNYYSRFRTTANSSFGVKNFRQYGRFKKSTYNFSRAFDELNWFGFYFNNNFYYNQIRRQRSNKPSTYSAISKSDIKKGFIEGVVITESDGLPLPGVSVIVKGTSKGVQTDFDGKFKIKAGKNDILNFSYVSLKSIDVSIGENNYFEISLAEDVAALDEVVVSAYGGRPDSKVLKSLQGQASGVSVISRSSAPAEIFDKEKAEIRSTKEDNELISSNPVESQIQIRKNLQETAFFFPQLQTDKDGNVSFSFTTPEALTQWKLQLLAHTKTLESAVAQFETVTQKELMVTPNAPRFLREGDAITISSKISNLSDKILTGEAQLLLEDALTGKDITETLLESAENSLPLGEMSEGQSGLFTVNPRENTQVSWQLKIPENSQAVQYTIIAKAENFSDGEQSTLPVLSNRMMVTETLPMWIRSNETKTFTLDKLKDNESTTLKNHKLTLEITSNPAWYAVQALPYLMEYPYDCNEQTFSRYYANALASHIANSNPRIQEVFNQWKNTDAMLSNLEKNQELKSLLIEETPWLRDAQSETEQKKRIALLFDLNKMTNELQSAIKKLKNNQHSSGAWPWFNGGRNNRYITQHIIAGFGHLKQLSVTSSGVEMQMITNAIKYLDKEFIQEYKDLKKYNDKVDLSKDQLSYMQLHYLYTRSFYPEIKASKDVEKIMAYYKGQIQNYWLKRSLYAKGLMALTMHRMNDAETAGKILKSLEENSITSEELGMYWKENSNSWYWYQAPIETQALMIEAFSEVGSVILSETKNLEIINNLKIWLLKNKQTNQWKTTKATTEAVYALLLQGSDWLSLTDAVDVKVGNESINPSTIDNVKLEAGTGYFKTSWSGSEIKPEQANVTLTKKGDGIAWGALYWQYFEDLDKITSSETPLKLSKKLFLKSNTDKGEEISEITAETKLEIGDLVRVRIELSADRNMEFIHLKDMRASGFEPVNVLSQYKWQDGLGYYESTKDASTNFFIDYLPKGIYVFEYDLCVNNAGNMSNGISTIQSMYAPEFNSHSEGVRVKVD